MIANQKLSLLLAVGMLSLGTFSCSEEKGLRITSVTPDTGPTRGGTMVTIGGSGFKKAKALGVSVYFDKKEAVFLRFEGDDEMMIRSPPGKLGDTADIHIVFGDGREHNFKDAFKYVDLKGGFGIDALAPSDKTAK